jgi:hypothetical protein
MEPESEERMALIKCPECSGDISDKAAACPHCGYPIGRTAQGAGPVQVIEKTGRGWKAVRVLGWLLIVGGVLIVRAGRATPHAGRAPVGWWIAGSGLACLITSKAGAWWYHG